MDHFEIVRRLVVDLETGNTRNLIGYQYINDILWQFSEFPTVPDPKNFSFQGPETFRARKSDLCLSCLHYSSFNNSENDTMQLSLNEAKLTGLWARSCATIQQVLVLKIKLPSAPKSFWAFLESGPRFPTSWAQISKWLPKKTHRSKWSLINKLTPVFLCVGTQASGSTTTLTMLRRHFIINKRTDTQKNWRQFVFYNNKSSEKSNFPVKMKKTQQNLWLIYISAMLLSITFLAWWLATEDKQRSFIG